MFLIITIYDEKLFIQNLIKHYELVIFHKQHEINYVLILLQLILI